MVKASELDQPLLRSQTGTRGFLKHSRCSFTIKSASILQFSQYEECFFHISAFFAFSHKDYQQKCNLSSKKWFLALFYNALWFQSA